MTIFLNRHIGPDVTVDLDVFFFYFVRPIDECPEVEKPGVTLQTIRERLSRLSPLINFTGVYAEYRRSSRDHVHVRLRFAHSLSVLDGFMIRAWMLDDQTRLSLDLSRYLLSDDLNEINRCFDEKAEGSGIKRAGPWISLNKDRNDFDGDDSDDWDEYMIRFMRKDQSELDFC